MSQLDLVSMFFTGKDHDTNLLEIRIVLHQVHAASVMISSHMDTSLEALQHFFRSYVSCMLSLVIKSSHSCRDDQVFHSCRDDGLLFI